MIPSSRLLCALAVVGAAACADRRRDHFDPGDPSQGGGGGGGEVRPDAGEDALDAGTRLSGRLCPIADLRRPTFCGAADLTDVPVLAQPGFRGADVASDGEFVIEDAGQVIRLEVATVDPTYHPSRVPIAPWSLEGEVVAPLIRETAWLDLLDALPAIEPDDSGSIALYLVDADGDPLAGATVVAPEGASNPPFYGGASALDWQVGVDSGTSGAVLLVGVPDGVAEITAAVGERTANLEVLVASGALSFAVLTL